jgi:hypothetical protein
MITLASSFRLRNKLKEKILKYQNNIYSSSFSKDVGTEEETNKLDGLTIEQAIKVVNNLMDGLRELNIAIDEVNVINKKDLITLETLKASIAFYERINENLHLVRKFRQETNETGGYSKIEIEPVVNQSEIVSTIENLKKAKDVLEERIANTNFKITLNIDEREITELL